MPRAWPSVLMFVRLAPMRILIGRLETSRTFLSGTQLLLLFCLFGGIQLFVLPADIERHYDASGNTILIKSAGMGGPSFNDHSTVIAPEIGRFLSLSINAQGAAPVSYQWQFAGVNIPNATNDSLLITNFAPELTGLYWVIASNSFGSATSEVFTVSLDIDHDSLPDAWEKEYFGNLSQTASGDPDGDGVSNLDEFRDGTNPNDPTSVFPRLNIPVMNGGSIATFPDVEKYRVGQVVQLTAVPLQGQSFIGWLGEITDTNTTVSVVMDRTKKVEAVFGLPLSQVLDSPSLAWKTGGDSGWFGQTEISHDSFGAAEGITGLFETNWLETVVTGPATVDFWWRVSSLKDKSVFACLVDGGNRDQISGEVDWRETAVYLSAGEHVVRWQWNKTGSDLITGDFAWLDSVAIKPGTTAALFKTSPSSLQIPRGGDARFQVSAAGTPPLSYEWRFNGKAIPGESGPSLVITNVQPVDAGDYTVLVGNMVGSAMSQVASLEVVPSKVVGWSYYFVTPPADLTNAIAVSAGFGQNLALRPDGTVTAWGELSLADYGQTRVPPGLSNVVDISAGIENNLVLKSDGTVFAWGRNDLGQTDVPKGLRDVASVDARSFLAVRNDGTVVAWSFFASEALASLTNVLQVVEGPCGFFVLHPDGALSNVKSTNCPGIPDIPSSLTNVVAIKGNLALTSDGTVASFDYHPDSGWGWTMPLVEPEGLTNVVDIATSIDHSLALRADGSILAWGSDKYGQTEVPENLGYAAAISVGVDYDVAIVTGGFPTIARKPVNRTVAVGSVVQFNVGVVGHQPVAYQWVHNGTPIPDATGPSLLLKNVQLSDAGEYNLTASNSYGVASQSVSLKTFPSAPTVALNDKTRTAAIWDEVEFVAAATGAEPLRYQWQLNGTEIYAATNSTLHLMRVDPSKAGSYRVVVHDGNGEEVSSAASTLTIVQPHPDAADSLWLAYRLPEGSETNHTAALYNEVTVTNEASGTDVGALVWLRGYCGLHTEETKSGTNRSVVFGLWDVATNEPPTVVWSDEDVRIERFERNGQGSRAVWTFPWANATTYRFIVRLQQIENGTQYAFSFFDPGLGHWKQVATMQTRSSASLERYAASFIEDVSGTRDKERSASYQNTHFIDQAGRWIEITQATGPTLPNSGPYQTVAGSSFQLRSGGRFNAYSPAPYGSLVRQSGRGGLTNLVLEARMIGPSVMIGCPQWDDSPISLDVSTNLINWSSVAGPGILPLLPVTPLVGTQLYFRGRKEALNVPPLNLLANGGFEMSHLSSGCFEYLAAESTNLAGWTVSPDGIGEPSYLQRADCYAVPVGQFSLLLNQGDSLTTQVDVSKNRFYLVSLLLFPNFADGLKPLEIRLGELEVRAPIQNGAFRFVYESRGFEGRLPLVITNSSPPDDFKNWKIDSCIVRPLGPQ